MQIALVQIGSRSGDIEWNIQQHHRVLNQLRDLDLDLIIFPELSLCNYEPTIASSCAIKMNDARLEVFQTYANDSKTSIAVGLLSKMQTKPMISVLFFQAHHSRRIFSKQYLHADELEFFTPAEKASVILPMPQKTALAICYELSVDAHMEQAAAQRMELYIATVAKTVSGIESAKQRLCMQAKKYNVPILVVNSIGYCEGKPAGGGSMIIAPNGEVMAMLSQDQAEVLIYDSQQQSHSTMTIEI
ncbi:MAG: carbon-nitrogen hydrolase family protein [Gammaproteobacteria bacterium]|nr:carbon-nitrogen hydrolase family protein [Gammaproteobacteria bacterium]